MSTRPGHRPSGRSSHRAGRDVLLALALKACMLGALYLLFFGPGRRPAADAAATAAALTGSAAREVTR